MHTVSKNRFIQVLQNYHNCTPDDAREIQALKDDFPYSQVLHALLARLGKDHQLPTQKADLQVAAVYAADRGVLKQLMDQPAPSWPASHEVTGMVHPETPESISAPVGGDESDSGVADALIQDLHRLSAARHNFESLYEQQQEDAGAEEKAVGNTKAIDGHDAGHEHTGTAGKSKKQRIIELVKALQEEEDPQFPDLEQGDKGDQIISEISSKKKIEIDGALQREQVEIIDQFIRSQPSISAARRDKAQQAPDDLAEVRSGDFGDHVISETLVEILVNQGKKERAIEVLKKLIWKFPQKKAYFAAQIEALKQ